MTTARDIMHAGAECVGEHESLQRAAQLMRDLDVGALPICGDDNRLKGIVTDRDIVCRCVAEGYDPANTTAGVLDIAISRQPFLLLLTSSFATSVTRSGSNRNFRSSSFRGADAPKVFIPMMLPDLLLT